MMAQRVTESPATRGRRRTDSADGFLSEKLRSSPMLDRRTPLNLTGERETLLEFLDYLRESVILKVENLDEDSARRSMVPTGTSLLGLVKHLTGVEVAWFQFAF